MATDSPPAATRRPPMTVARAVSAPAQYVPVCVVDPEGNMAHI